MPHLFSGVDFCRASRAFLALGLTGFKDHAGIDKIRISLRYDVSGRASEASGVLDHRDAVVTILRESQHRPT